MDCRDIINAKEIGIYIENLPPEVLIGESLFPRKKQLGMDLKHIKGSRQRPVVLKQSTFDVSAKIRALKADVSEKTKRMPFFKESVIINEEDRQQLLLAMAAQNPDLIDMITSQIFDSYKALVDGGDVQMERMRNQLLADGTIKITSDDGDIVFDFEIPDDHKEVLTGDAVWSNPDADIIGDLQRYKQKMINDGYSELTRMVLTPKTFSYIMLNKAIKLDIDRDGRAIITNEMIKDYLSAKINLSVAIISGIYRLEEGSEQTYFPDNKVTLIPDGNLGYTYYGTTPEEADKMFNQSRGALDCSIVRTGIAITTMKKEDPVTVQTKVSQLGMPSFQRADECFFITVV